MTFLWILLGIVYVACWIYFGLATFRKGHYWMLWIGFFLPFLWIIGALIAPTPRAAASVRACVQDASGAARRLLRDLDGHPFEVMSGGIGGLASRLTTV